MDFRVLGPLEVAEQDRPLALGARRQRALLAFLLLHANEVVAVERLVDELWGEAAPATVGKSVQVYVSGLRKQLGGGRLLTRAPGYLLRVDPSEFDLARFERLVAAAARADPDAAARGLRDALALWRGPALADLAYEPFAQSQIARLEELRLLALEQRIDADLACGRHAELIGELESLVSGHPLREGLRGRLMLALYRSGRQAEALAAYSEARVTLTEELGLEPGRALRDLQEAILRQDEALERVAPRARAPSRGALVGRGAEVAELAAAVDEVSAGHGRMLLVSGGPGIGKSRLLDELGALAAAGGARVLLGRCWESGGAPAYWPWIQALGEYARGTERDMLLSQLGRAGADLATIVPEIADVVAPRPAEAVDGGGRFRLFAAIAGFLRRAAAARPLALLLDDLHAADPPSLVLLRFMVAELVDARLLIAGCYRDTDVGAPLAEVLPDLAREASVRRFTLAGLGAEDTRRLLEQTLGATAPRALVASVHERTEGNPLFVVETGRLIAAEPVDPGEQLPIPAGVTEAIRRRLDARSGRCRRLLVLASTIGREFDVEPLELVSGLGEDELCDALEEAEAARLIGGVPGASGRLRFSHVLVRDAIYDDLPAPRRLRLHRQIGEAFEALYERNPEPHLAELAHHYLLGGSRTAAKAIEYARRAGDRAASMYGYEDAARHYASALETLEATGAGDPAASCELLLSLGDALSRAGNEQAAKAVVRRAAAVAERERRPEQLARAALLYCGRFSWARASSDPELVPLLDRALAAVGPDDDEARAQLLARMASARRDDRRREQRIALADEAVAIARGLGKPAILSSALESRWNAVEGPYTGGADVRVTDELIARAEATGDPERLYIAHDHRLNVAWRHADRAGVDVGITTVRRLASELRQPAQRWGSGTYQTMLALMEGRLEEAEQLIAETFAIGQSAASWNASVSHRMALFQLRREQGRLDELEDVLARSVREYPALLRFACALAHLHAELGHAGKARALLDDLVGLGLANEHVDAEWLFSVVLLADACSFLRDAGTAAHLHALLLPFESLYAQAPVEACFGSAARALGVLATTARRFEEAERHFAVALETERRMRARPWLAHARHGLGVMLLERAEGDDVERAAAVLDEAARGYRELRMESWAARCERQLVRP